MSTSNVMMWDTSTIEDVCKDEFNRNDNNTDCKWFVKAVSDHFVDATAFPERTSNLDADAVIATYLVQHGWTALGQDQDEAMAEVGKGNLVIGGMTSGDFGKSASLLEVHGHLAVIVGGTEYAGTAKKNVPRCYSGSLSESGRVPRAGAGYGVNWSFGAKMVDHISYFSIAPTKAAPARVPMYNEKPAREIMKEILQDMVNLVCVEQQLNDQTLFPNGVNKIDVSVAVGPVKIELHVSGA